MLLILRIILLILIIRAVLMLVRGVIDGKRGGPRQVPPPKGVQLVRDPVCGVYVKPSEALTVPSGVGKAYFCSEKCKQEWQQP